MSQHIIFPDSPFYRLAVSQYHQMIEHCIFNDSDRAELLDGLVLYKHPQSSEPIDRLYKYSKSQYLKMLACGILEQDGPVKLVDGILQFKRQNDADLEQCDPN